MFRALHRRQPVQYFIHGLFNESVEHAFRPPLRYSVPILCNPTEFARGRKGVCGGKGGPWPQLFPPCPGWVSFGRLDTTAVRTDTIEPERKSRVNISVDRFDDTFAGTLYDELGGADMLARIVHEFYSRVHDDPKLSPIFPDDLF